MCDLLKAIYLQTNAEAIRKSDTTFAKLALRLEMSRNLLFRWKSKVLLKSLDTGSRHFKLLCSLLRS